jgi:hypothetical protein
MKKIYLDKQLLNKALRELIENTVERSDFSPLQALLQVKQKVSFSYRYRRMTERYLGRLQIGSVRATKKLVSWALEFLIFQTMRLSELRVEYSWSGLCHDKGECVTVRRVL